MADAYAALERGEAVSRADTWEEQIEQNSLITLSPIIMEVENGYVWKVTNYSFLTSMIMTNLGGRVPFYLG